MYEVTENALRLIMTDFFFLRNLTDRVLFQITQLVTVHPRCVLVTVYFYSIWSLNALVPVLPQANFLFKLLYLQIICFTILLEIKVVILFVQRLDCFLCLSAAHSFMMVKPVMFNHDTLFPYIGYLLRHVLEF